MNHLYADNLSLVVRYDANMEILKNSYDFNSANFMISIWHGTIKF